jgi:hypothetical protein
MACDAVFPKMAAAPVAAFLDVAAAPRGDRPASRLKPADFRKKDAGSEHTT